MTRLTDFHGIGPALAKRLEAAGIVDGKTLAEADPAVLTAIPGVSALRAATWQKTAAESALTAPSDIPADQPDTTVVLLQVSSADTAPVDDAPVEPSEPKAKSKKKPAKGKKKDDKAKSAKSKKAEKPAKPKKAEKPAKKAEKSKKADADAKKTETKKKPADKGKADKAKKTKAKSKKKAKAA
ncbi:MAG: helix-hairpin-helix domain-containing protein [Pelagibaca sp.]